MSISNQESRFDQDLVSLVVREYGGSVPVMSRSFCEDIRYWSDGTETPIGDDRIFLQRPEGASYIPVEPEDGIEMGYLYLPSEWVQKLGIPYAPIEMDFFMTRPSYSSQLERFY